MLARALRRIGTPLALASVIGLGFSAQPAWAETVRDQQWYLSQLNISAVHAVTKGAGVVVAVVDSGVAPHADLTGQVLDSGYSYVGRETDAYRDNTGHGTSMAGLIAAKGGDANHLLGIAPEAKILPVRVISTDDGMPNGETIFQGIRWAADHGAKVINVSISGGGSSIDREAIDYALSKDAVVVASTGNVNKFFSDINKVLKPAAIPGVVAVTAVDQKGALGTFAMRGKEVVLAAPGTAMSTLQPKIGSVAEGYKTSEGTSNSAAIVSGAAALIRAKYPSLSANDVIKRLISTADDRGTPGFDNEYGYGQLNLLKALTADVSKASGNPLVKASASPSAGGQSPSPDGITSQKLLLVGGVTCASIGLLCGLVIVVFVLTRRRTHS